MTEWLRLLNVVLGFTAAAAFLVRANDALARLRAAGVSRVTLIGVQVLLVAIAVGSAVAYVRHVPPTGTAPLVTLGLALVLTGLWRSRRR